MFDRTRVCVTGITVFCVLLFAGAVAAQNFDYSAIVTDSADPVEPGEVVSFEVEIANAGPDISTDTLNVDITLPMGVPMSWTEYLALDDTARGLVNDAFLASSGFATDTSIWDDLNSGLFMGESFNNACAGPIIQTQSLILPAGASGKLYFDAEMPVVGSVPGVAYKAVGGDMMELNYGRGGCNSVAFSDCGDGTPTGFPCMGTPLTVHTAVPAPITVAGEGCEITDFNGFPVGNVALIDRGTCNFSAKANNATLAGASGVIIGNNDTATVTTPTLDSVMAMGCTDDPCHSLTMSPSAFISYNDATAIKAALAQGEVSAYLGLRNENPEYRTTEGYIWTNGDGEENADNDRDRETTTVAGDAIFTDGFESGDTSAWSNGKSLPVQERPALDLSSVTATSRREMTEEW